MHPHTNFNNYEQIINIKIKILNLYTNVSINYD